MAIRDCYRIAGLEWPGVVVWTASPLALCLAGPTAELTLERSERGSRERGLMAMRAVVDATRASAGERVAAAIEVAVTQAVDGALNAGRNGSTHRHDHPGAETVTDYNGHGPVSGELGRLVHENVEDELIGLGQDDLMLELQDLLDRVTEAEEIPLMLAVERDVEAVKGTLESEGGGNAGDEAARAAAHVISDRWMSFNGLVNNYLRYWECEMDLERETRDGARAFEDALAAAGWWWPCERFVLIAERPLRIDDQGRVPTDRAGHEPDDVDTQAMLWPDSWSV